MNPLPQRSRLPASFIANGRTFRRHGYNRDRAIDVQLLQVPQRTCTVVKAMASEIFKSAFGVYKVRFDCPRCKERLTANLSEAGKTDQCPSCLTKFRVRGAAQRKSLQDKQAKEKEKRATNRASTAERRKRQKAARLEAKRRQKAEERKRQYQEQIAATLDLPDVESESPRNSLAGKASQPVHARKTFYMAREFHGHWQHRNWCATCDLLWHLFRRLLGLIDDFAITFREIASPTFVYKFKPNLRYKLVWVH